MPSSFQKAVRKALRANADPEVRDNFQRYFKDAVKLVGVRAPGVRQVFRDTYHLLANNVPDSVIEEAFDALSSEFLEEKQIGIMVLSRIEKKLPADFVQRLEPVFDRTVYDWATCDVLSSKVLRLLLRRDAAARRRIISWSKANYLWRQRASAVAFVNEARHGKYNKEIISVCGNIVNNPERFVQLGMGWVLRELSLADRQLALDFLARHYKRISREGLRYAIEKLPLTVRKRLLAEHAAATAENKAPARTKTKGRRKG